MRVEGTGRSAFASIYEKYFKLTYKTALRYSGNHHAAEELTQSVFLKLYVHMEHAKVDAVKPWLLLTVKYMALNQGRDRAREYLTEDMESSADLFEEAEEQDPQEMFLKKMHERQFGKLVDDIFAALYRKNPRWYEAVTITYVLGKPQKEVAEAMGITLEVLHSMLYRAKNWIRKNYREEYDCLIDA